MAPAPRLLRLLSLLQARHSWTAAELAERLEVDRRTIRRDIAHLRQLGYPVSIQPGRSGYQLGAGGHLPPLLLDDAEAVAMAVGLRLASTAAVTGIEDAAVAALAKLDQVLPVHLREQVRALDASTVHLHPAPSDGSRVDPDTLSLLAGACRNAERVGFAYVAFGDVESSRRVEPLQIVHVNRRWYLVGWDLDRKDWRTFRVDRITEAVRTGHRFEFQDPPDAVQKVLDGLSFGPYLIEARIRLHVDGDRVRARLAADGGEVEDTGDGTSLLRIAGASVDQLARYLVGLPWSFQVISPDELRQQVASIADRLVESHVGQGRPPEVSAEQSR